MAFKRRAKKNQGDGEEWLMTYADAITLLLCFFVIILNVAEPKVGSFERLREGFMSEFTDEPVSTPFSDIYDAFQSIVDANLAGHDISVEETERGIMLEFDSASIFAPGSAQILPRAEPMLDDISLEINSFEYDGYVVEIEGHTDNEPINTPLFPSNWELSAVRSASVVKFFIGKGMPPQRLRASGYADTFPKVPNTDSFNNPLPDNQAINRRVVIRLERP